MPPVLPRWNWTLPSVSLNTLATRWNRRFSLHQRESEQAPAPPQALNPSPPPRVGPPSASSSPRPLSTSTPPVAATPTSCSSAAPPCQVSPVLFCGRRRDGPRATETSHHPPKQALNEFDSAESHVKVGQHTLNTKRLNWVSFLLLHHLFFALFLLILITRLTVLAGSVQHLVRYTIWLNDTNYFTTITL